MPTKDSLSAHFDDMRGDEPLDAHPVAAYPAERLRFVTAAGEDTAVVDAAPIRTGEFHSAFWAKAQIDIRCGFFDGSDSGESVGTAIGEQGTGGDALTY